MFSIGEVSRLTNVKIPTIRFYEKAGIIDAPIRSVGNQRCFDKKGVERLTFIHHARELGLSITTIRELVSLSETPQKTCTEAHMLALSHLRSIETRITKLKKLQKELKRIATNCNSDNIGECYVIRALADHGLCMESH